MSDSNRLRVSIRAKGSLSEAIPSNAAWLVLPTTGHSMRDRTTYQRSQIINNNRNLQDLVRTGKAGGGTLPTELFYSPSGEALMTLIRAALAGTETAAATIACTTIGGAKEIERSAGDFNNDVEVGDILKISSAVKEENEGFVKVAAIDNATQITVEADANFAGGDETCTVTRGARIKNGTEKLYFDVEIAHLDIQKARVFSGVAVNGMNLAVADEAITTISFALESATSTFYEANNGTADLFTAGTPTYALATVSPVLDSVGVPEIRSEGVAYTAKAVQTSVLNNVTPRTQIGSLGAQSMRHGEFSATGSISSYLEDFAALSAYANNTASDLWKVMLDSSGKGYSLSYPRFKFEDAGADVSGSNTDVTEELSFVAVEHPTELISIRFQRWD